MDDCLCFRSISFYVRREELKIGNKSENLIACKFHGVKKTNTIR